LFIDSAESRKFSGIMIGVRKFGTLTSLKLGQVWESELVGREQDWKSLVKASLRAREEADWKDQMEKKPKLRLYRTLMFALERKEYLDVV